jgi:dihydrofolate reductase
MKILKTYTYIDPDWLLSGEGNMTRSKTTPTSIQSDLFSAPSPQPPTPLVPSKNPVVSENRKETKVEKTQNIIKQPVQEPVIVKKIESRNVSKIMIFYSDSTYETFIPEKIKKD